ncbi:hypothetical protein [Microvirga puerhi]|uniref:Uncharacterized protein n=1 Tax=Microvirga puerhi TaxID=2876078 RepID=A0ABS7VPC9_9HYPH|nr:hypothetical protein [Microvirga puerhi]MBZ6076867.1 hypothetical protein [Microvirga puerhi]
MSKNPLRAGKPKPPAGQGASVDLENDASVAETAQYIAEFTAELSFLARRSNLDLLAYLLDMARLEAMRSMQSAGKKR